MNFSLNLLSAFEYDAVLTTLIFWVDVVVKSCILVCVAFALCLTSKYQYSSSVKYSLWLQTLLGVALLPLFTLTYLQFAGDWFQTTSLLTIDASPSTSKAIASLPSGVAPDPSLTLILYLMPTLVLALNLYVAYFRVRQISSRAVSSTKLETNKLLTVIQKRLLLNAAVSLKYSHEVSAPFSYGLFKPNIILPATAENWSSSMLEDVLIHELAHIQRRDWLAMTVSHVIACIFWFNPLCWLLKSKLNDEAENCCDAQVLQFGKLNTTYAENLISIAKQSSAEPSLLAQTLVNKSKLHKRVKLILEGNMKLSDSKSIRHLYTSFITAIVVLGASMQVLAADDGREELYPINTPLPVYPADAEEQNLEGWVLVEFTIDAAGGVDGSTVKVVSESVPGVFSESSIAAAENFQFSPRIDQGKAVAVPGVQYVFRYVLEQ